MLDRLRDDPRTQNLPVRVYTAADLTGEDRARLAGRVRGITAKPGVARLLDDLAAAVGRPRPSGNTP